MRLKSGKNSLSLKAKEVITGTGILMFDLGQHSLHLRFNF